MKVVFDDQLNADLARVFNEGKEFITIISPYIKLSDRTKDILRKTAKSNPHIKLSVVFGKNESSPNKSLHLSDLDFFIHEFKDVSIFYKERLHAKCYVNERMGMITSMNLYDYSLMNNLELGVFYENNGIIDDFIKQTNMAIDYLSSQKASSIEGQVHYYVNHVIESSYCIYQKTAVFKDKYFGLASEYSNSEIKIDRLVSFFKKYVDNYQNDGQDYDVKKNYPIKASSKSLPNSKVKSQIETKIPLKKTDKTGNQKVLSKVSTASVKPTTKKISVKSKAVKKK